MKQRKGKISAKEIERRERQSIAEWGKKNPMLAYRMSVLNRQLGSWEEDLKILPEGSTLKVFLDLEDTIITDWFNSELKNFHAVKTFLKEHQITNVWIFSFAIWDARDADIFDRKMKSWLEREYEIEIDGVVTVDEMEKTILWKQGMEFTTSEFLSVWGKQRAFHDYITLTQPEGEFLLIDDMVQSSTTTIPKSKQTIDFLNVLEIPKPNLTIKETAWQP